MSHATLAAALLLCGVGDVAVPRLTGPVVDQVGLLSAGERDAIAVGLRRYKEQTQNEIGVLIMHTLDGAPIEDYSIRVVEKWQLGTAERDNGVLLLLAMQDRKWRIEVGGGLEGELTDVQASRIGRGILTQHFQRQEYARGIASTLEAVVAALGGELSFANIPSARQRPARGGRRFGFSGVIFFFIFMLLALGGRGRRGGIFGWLLLGSLLGGGRRGGWGGGGGGSFGGGGGSWGGGGGGFSGGGASGGW